MTEQHSVIKSAFRIGAASVLTAIAVLMLVASGPMRAGWGVIGNSTNASNTVVSLMKTPSVQHEVGTRLLIEIEKSVSPQVAKQIAANQAQLSAAVVTLLNNSVVQQLVAQKVQAAYGAIQNQTPTVLDFTDLVNQATSVIHQIDPNIPAKIAGANKFNVTFNPSSNPLGNINALGSGSVALWFLGTLFLVVAAFALSRTRTGKYVVTGIGFLLPAIILFVLAGSITSLVMSGRQTNQLAKAVGNTLCGRVSGSLNHTALLEILSGVIVAAAIFGFDKWWSQKSPSSTQVAD
jgi:hypothetical protein